MSDEKTDLNNVNISIEQIVAAILNKVGKIEITVEDLLLDYSNKNIAVNQNFETQGFIFELVDNQTETE